jgi:hypothetical protein
VPVGNVRAHGALGTNWQGLLRGGTVHRHVDDMLAFEHKWVLWCRQKLDLLRGGTQAC